VSNEAASNASGAAAPPPLVYFAGLAIGFVLNALLPSATLPGALRNALGWPLVLGGLALLVSFVDAFRRAGTPVDPNKATTTLVATGPYRLSRNPGYLGMTFVYAGIMTLTQALWALLPLIVAMLIIDRGVIAREERYLAREFGDAYLQYKARVRRWI
jgi:protein-S-isoprenylcysteine O-methyltransferase Ste14